MPRLRPFNDLRSPKQRKVTLSIFSRRLFWVLKHQNRPKNDEVSNFSPFLEVGFEISWFWATHLMVYLSRCGFAQTHYLKYRLRLTHRKRKKENWMSFKPPALLLKMGYFWSIKSRCGRWKNYLITNFFGWELFSSDGSTVGTLGKCISQNVPILVIANIYMYYTQFQGWLYQDRW